MKPDFTIQVDSKNDNFSPLEIYTCHGGGAAIIIDTESRYRYTNQTHGVSCNHPEASGQLVMLPDFVDPGHYQYDFDRFWTVEMYGDLRKAMLASKSFVEIFGTDIVLPDPVDDDPTWGSPWGEAWVMFYFTDRLGQQKAAILTWENSD